MITKEQFKRYQAVQKSGVTNMWDIGKVAELSGLSKKVILEIMKNYNNLEEENK